MKIMLDYMRLKLSSQFSLLKINRHRKNNPLLDRLLFATFYRLIYARSCEMDLTKRGKKKNKCLQQGEFN